MSRTTLSALAMVLVFGLTCLVLAGCSTESSSKPKTDTTPPSLDSASATDQYHVNAVFSEALDEATAEDPGNYLITGAAVFDTVDIYNCVLLSDEKTVGLETEAQDAALYDLTVAGVKDRAGNAMGSSTVQFVGTTSGDETPPEVASTIPSDGASGVSTTTTVVVQFSEKMDRPSAESSFHMWETEHGGPIVMGSFTWGANDSRMTFTPSAELTNYRQYVCQVTTAATDVSANHLESIYQWMFTVGNAGGISGTISYSGPLEPAAVGIGVFTTPCFSGEAAGNAMEDGPGPYMVYPLAPSTYYVGAFMDVDGDEEPSVGEPAGIYDTNGDLFPDPVNVQAGQVRSGINFALEHEFKFSTISGMVTKQPDVTHSDTTYVLCFTQDPAGDGGDAILTGVIPSGTGSYTTIPLFFGCYYVICFMDVNHNHELDMDSVTELPSEPVGLYGYVNGGEPVFAPIFLIDDFDNADMSLFYMTGPPTGLSSLLKSVSVVVRLAEE